MFFKYIQIENKTFFSYFCNINNIFYKLLYNITVMFETLTYQKRRQALRERMSNGLILILGNNEAPANYPDKTTRLRQTILTIHTNSDRTVRSYIFSDIPTRDMPELLT